MHCHIVGELALLHNDLDAAGVYYHNALAAGFGFYKRFKVGLALYIAAELLQSLARLGNRRLRRRLVFYNLV